MKSVRERISREFVAIPQQFSVAEAVEFIRKKKSELKDKFLYAYSVDAQGRLTGVLQLRDLLLSDPDMPVQKIAFPKPIFLYESDSDAIIERSFKKHPFFALPVVDRNEKLIGVVTASDAADIVRVESSRLIHHFAGMSGEEIEEKSIFRIISRRLPWLVFSMVSGLMCAYILGIFIEEIESMIALVLFIPIVLGVAGGVGVQSSVITLRGLSEGQLKLSEIGRVLAKEISIGLLIGLISCAMISLIALVWQKSMILGLAVGVSIVASVIASGVLGAILPIILKAFRINPAFASGLFVLLICDIVVMIIYFSLSFAIINPTI